MGDQEDSNKLVCPDCQFTTRKERKFVNHVKKTHDKDALKCPFCVTNVHYSSDTSGLCSHKRHRHRQIRLKCFLCEFSSKSLRRWTDHLIHVHGKQSQRVADLGNKQRNDCLSAALTSKSKPQICSTPNDRHNTKECKPQGKRYIENCSNVDVNKAISTKNQFEIGEKENGHIMKKRKYSKKRKRLCSEDDSKKRVIDLANDRKNEFSKKKSTDRIKRKQLFGDNDTAINVSSDESSYNKGPNKSDISKVDKGGDNPSKRKKTKSVDVLPSLSDAVMICLSSDEGHGETVKEESSKKEIEESIKLDSYLAMLRKKKSSGEENKFTCPYCDQCFSSYKIRKEHLKTCHSDFVTPESKYACKLCSYSCKYISVLVLHTKSHSSEQPFVCEICHQRFKLKYYLVRHMKVHSNEKPFVCEICHQRFKLKYYLVNHVRVHSNEKPFECHLCSFRSKKKCNIESHVRYHTNTRPYKCSMCDYAAHTMGHLDDHIRTHTGEKPFKCRRCHRGFCVSSSLNKHVKTRACY